MMPISDESAGTDVARTLASHLEGAHRRALPAPSEDLRKLFAKARGALDACQAQSFFFGPLNVLPKLALEKLTYEHRGSYAILRNEGGIRVIPVVADRSMYWTVLLDLLSAKETLLNVPEWAANALRKTYAVKKQQSEYVIPTLVLQTYRGGHLRNIRNLVHKYEREGSTEAFDPAKLEEYLALNRVWYRQNAEGKFRTYDKTSIDWLLENWTEYTEIDPTAQMIGVRDKDGKLVNFTVAGALTDSIWSAYTERFDRDAQDGANWYAWQLLAYAFGKYPVENDGTADTAQLRRNKGKLSPQMANFYTVSK